MQRGLFFGGLFFLLLVFVLLFFNMQMSTPKSPAIRYVSLGDSYSNGEGETPQDAWPVLLTRHLREAGYDIELVANPSVSGWTTQNLIDGELPQFVVARPTFATLLIGANDLFQGVEQEIAEKNFVTILDRMQEVIPNKQNIVILTIPNYAVSPQVSGYKDISEEQNKILRFNEFIKNEAGKRGLPVVDLFALTTVMGEDRSFFTADGLHPSVKQLRLWEEKIFPVVANLLKNT